MQPAVAAQIDALVAAVGITGRYGPRTQRVRNLLRSGGATKRETSGSSWWRGYRSERGTPHPALWLTEGGASLEHLKGYITGRQDLDYYDSDTGQAAAKAVLCNGYHADWTSGQQPAVAHGEKRPSFTPWTDFAPDS